ncbi:NADH dehydrogenase subunit 6 (mitochondrion) [Homalodisca vitripennis]|nr:NADH dehydrogenase subunit 6 [Homalodisca vitripennis]
MMLILLKNPMSMGMMLIVQTLFMCMLMNKMMITTWFMMITFLMMIGGLMILFMYMSSIASNEKFKLNMNMTLTMIIFIIISDEMMNENQVMDKLELSENNPMEKISMIKLYNEKSMIITMIMVMFLLLTMISTTKIVKLHEGPLRKKTYE